MKPICAHQETAAPPHPASPSESRGVRVVLERTSSSTRGIMRGCDGRRECAMTGLSTVMVLNWNSGEHLLACIRSLLTTVPEGTRILVIDNASTDGSIEPLYQYAGRIEIRKNQDNLGFARAYNEAIRDALEEYIMILNPDTLAGAPGWLERLVTMASRVNDAAIACKLMFAKAPSTINSMGGMVYWWTGPVDIGFAEREGGRFDDGLQPFAASGGAMLVKRTHFLEVGGFDERMFAYVEDLDLCWRLRLRGAQIGSAPDVKFLHVFSSSLGPMSATKVYLTHRNYLRAMLKNYELTTLFRALPNYLIWTALKTLGALVVERSVSLAIKPLEAVWWNAFMLRDTLQQRKAVQQTRVVQDKKLLPVMGPRGFETLANLRRRWLIAHGKFPDN